MDSSVSKSLWTSSTLLSPSLSLLSKLEDELVSSYDSSSSMLTIEPTFGNQKKSPAGSNGPQAEVIISLRKLTDELKDINSHKLIRIYDSLPQLLLLHFMKGVVFGLGTVVGATIVVTILAYVLAQFEFIPIIGEWIKLISEEINSHQPS